MIDPFSIAALIALWFGLSGNGKPKKKESPLSKSVIPPGAKIIFHKKKHKRVGGVEFVSHVYTAELLDGGVVEIESEEPTEDEDGNILDSPKDLVRLDCPCSNDERRKYVHRDTTCKCENCKGVVCRGHARRLSDGSWICTACLKQMGGDREGLMYLDPKNDRLDRREEKKRKQIEMQEEGES